MTAAGTAAGRALSSEVPLWRKLVAGALGIVASIALFQTAPSDWFVISLPLILLVVAAFTVHFSKLGPQLVSRAIWWSNLALGVVLSVLGGRREGTPGVVMAIACGLALVIIGRKGLAEASASDGYTPVAFRSSLFLLMVFALADAQTFLLFAIVSGNDERQSAVLMFVTAIAYMIGFLGLYRLKIWGAFVGVGTSVITLVVILSGLFSLPHDLVAFLAVVTVVHCLAAAPMLVALARGKTLPSLSARGRAIASNAVIGALVLAAIVAAMTRHQGG